MRTPILIALALWGAILASCSQMPALAKEPTKASIWIGSVLACWPDEAAPDGAMCQAVVVRVGDEDTCHMANIASAHSINRNGYGVEYLDVRCDHYTMTVGQPS